MPPRPPTQLFQSSFWKHPSFICTTLLLNEIQRHKASTWENTPGSPRPVPSADWKYSGSRNPSLNAWSYNTYDRGPAGPPRWPSVLRRSLSPLQLITTRGVETMLCAYSATDRPRRTCISTWVSQLQEMSGTHTKRDSCTWAWVSTELKVRES